MTSFFNSLCKWPLTLSRFDSLYLPFFHHVFSGHGTISVTLWPLCRHPIHSLITSAAELWLGVAQGSTVYLHRIPTPFTCHGIKGLYDLEQRKWRPLTPLVS